MFKHILAAFTVLVLAMVGTTLAVENIRSGHPTKEELKAFVAGPARGEFGDAFEVDVTNDDRPEIFLGFACGNGGCGYFCFKNNGDGTYTYAGTLFLRTDFFELLDASHEGFRDIQAFSPSGAGAGVRTMYQMSEGEYRSVKSVEINSQDGVKRMYPPDLVELNW